MLSDEEELKKIKAIYNRVGDDYGIVPFSDEQKLAFHKYMKEMTQNLLGDTVDLDKENIVFVLSDNSQPNAAFVSNSKDDSKFIYVTASLFKFCENKDQLGFVLGHELGHLEEHLKKGAHKNNKIEEGSSDVKAVSKMARAGLNIEQANVIANKIFSRQVTSLLRLIDAHPSDVNRVKSIDTAIGYVRKNLIKKGASAEIIDVVSQHEFEDEIRSLVRNLPEREVEKKEEEIRDNPLANFFYSETYKKASYEERVDMWFEKFNQSLVMEEVYGEQVYTIDYNASESLSQYCWQLIAEGKGKSYYFEEKFLENMLNEKTVSLALSKRNIYSRYRASATSSLKYLKLPRDKFGKFVKEKFGNLRNITDKEQAGLMLANMSIIRANLRWEDWRNLVDRNVLDLSYSEKDLGKTFSEAILNYDMYEVSLGKLFDCGDLQKGTKWLKDGGKYFLIENDGKISAVDENFDRISSKLLTDEVNDMVKKLCDIRDGKIDDDALKIDALKQATEMFCVKKTADFFVQWRDLKQALSLSIKKGSFGFSSDFSYVNFPGKQLYFFKYYLNRGSAENKTIAWDGLSKEAKSFMLDDSSLKTGQSNIEFVIDMLVKGMKEEDKTRSLFSRGIHELLEYSVFQKELLPQTDRLMQAFLENVESYCSSSFNSEPNVIRDVYEYYLPLKLCQHLKSGKKMNDFEFPFGKEYKDIIGRWVEHDKFNIKKFHMDYYYKAMGKYFAYELLKENPVVDLSQGDGKESLLKYLSLDGHGILKENLGEETTQQLWSQIKKNLNDPKNWGDGSEQNGVSFAERFNKIVSVVDSDWKTPIKARDLQDVALYFYEHASVQDKIEYFAAALKKTIGKIDTEKENKEVKDKIWQVIKKDFENKDISLKDRLTLFCKLEQQNLLDDNKEHYFETLVGVDGKGGLLKEIDEAPAPKFNYYSELLKKENRIPDPDIRAEVIHRAVQAYWQENGCYNDIEATKDQRAEFLNKIKNLKNDYLKDVPEVEKREFLYELANVTLSQRELSFAIKPDDFEINTQDKETIAAAYGVEILCYLMQEKALNREILMNYLLGDGSEKSTQDTLQMCRHDLSNYIEEHPRSDMKKYFNLLTPQYFRRAKKEFDAAPLEGKAAIINLLSEGNDWEKRFNQVADKLFAEAGELGGIGKKFLKAYIASRPGSERCFYLSAMYVAAKNNTVTFDDKSKPYTKEQRSLAQGLRLFLENSGPAGVKLAQAMSSYTGVPDYIRDEMQKAKSNANPPARWEIFEWIDKANENRLLDLGYIGEILGSASFYGTFKMKTKDGKDKVVKILRQGAKNLAESEFKIYRNMLKLMINEFGWGGSFKRLVDNAASMVDVETNLEIGVQQMRYAKELYPEKCRADKVDFNIKVMDWTDWGTMWATMEEAKGVDFKDLEQPYKKAAAKAVFVTELSNMLSGQRFDSDRHAGQYKFDTTTNTIGVFDTGSISVVEPTEKEKYVLGAILARTTQGLMENSENTPAGVLCAEIDKGIEHFYAKEIKEGKPIPPYLSEFQRGLLALTDFHQEIPAKELSVCVMQALNNGKHKLDPEIYRGFTETIEVNVPQAARKIVSSSNLGTEENSLMTPEAKMAQNLGKMVAAKVLEKGNAYEVLTTQVKSETTVDVLSSSVGQIQFAKGMMKEVFGRIDSKSYDSEQKQQIGRLLYHVMEEGVRQKKLHQEVSIAKIFEQKTAQMPQLGEYAKNVLSVVHLAEEFGLDKDVEVFKKAVLLGRLADKDVQKGYGEALRESPNNSFVKKALSHVSPVALVPEKTSRDLMKFVMKKVAPKYANMITRMKKMTNKREEHGK